MAALEKVLIGGRWRTTRASGIFNAVNPANRSPLPGLYPVSALDDVEEAVEAAARAAESLAGLEPERLADFLERYARRIEGRREELVQTAFEETALDGGRLQRRSGGRDFIPAIGTHSQTEGGPAPQR